MSNKVKELRQALNLTQLDLSECVGVTRITILNIENGSVPRLKLAIKIARFFNKNVEDVFLVEDDLWKR